MNGINAIFQGITTIKAVKPAKHFGVTKFKPPMTSAENLLNRGCSEKVLNKNNSIIESFKKINLENIGASLEELLGRFLGARYDFCPWFPKKIK